MIEVLKMFVCNGKRIRVDFKTTLKDGHELEELRRQQAKAYKVNEADILFNIRLLT